MIEIKLTQNQVALIDDEDFEKVANFSWHLHKTRNLEYARAYCRGTGRKGFCQIYMHKLIYPVPKGCEVDHKNGNGLDNRKANLRGCLHGQNIRNSIRRKGKTSIYRGVSWNPYHNKWRASIKINSKYCHIGYFMSEVEAALAYNRIAIQNFPQYAHLNEVSLSVDNVLV